MARLIIAGFILLVSNVMYGQCEASAATRLTLYHSQETIASTRSELYTRQTAILDKELAEHPHDYFLLRARMLADPQKETQIAWAETQRKKYSGRWVYELLQAKALEGKNTTEAIRRLEELKVAHPEAAQIYLELAANTGLYFQKFYDQKRGQNELDGFLKLCPATTDETALQVLGLAGTPEQISRAVGPIRKHLREENDPHLRQSWESLWRLEFKIRPPAEHEAVRREIAEDIRPYEQSPEKHRLYMLMLLRRAYENLGNPVAREKVSEKILNGYPTSSEAAQIVQRRWETQHPKPAKPSKAESEAYYRECLTAAEEWHKLWPDNPFILQQKLKALINLSDSSTEEVATTADQLLVAYRKNPDWHTFWPLEFDVANAWLKRKIRLDQVPALVEDSYRAAREFVEPIFNDDRWAQDGHTAYKERLEYLVLGRARRMLDYYDAANQPDKARAIDAELNALNPEPDYASWVLELRAHAAELDGRKLDAMVLYRAAIESRTDPPQDNDTLMENLERLWKVLGGTPAAYDRLLDKSKLVKATGGVWERPKSQLPKFTVQSLDGRTWKLADLEGKAVIINVWATWCSPCREELPQLQKLYEKLKDRQDVLVLSFNAYDDIGKVGPYMKEHKFTFPVLLAHDIFTAVSQSGRSAIPQTWVVNRGKLQWIKVGYDADKWQETMTGKLEDALKQTP